MLRNNHDCCAWCDHPIHVYTASFDDDVETAEQIIQKYSQLIQDRFHMRVIRVWKAHEADRLVILEQRRKKDHQTILNFDGSVDIIRNPDKFEITDNLWNIMYEQL